MAKLTGPLFSLEAIGKIADTLYYHFNRAGNYVSRVVKKKYTRTGAQDVIRKLFSKAISKWKRMSEEEYFLWDLATRNYQEYGSHLKKYVSRRARCLFLSHVLLTQKFLWEGNPFPPSLWQMLAIDEIEGYNQLIADLETLTGLSFCKKPNPYFFQYLGRNILGLCAFPGPAIAIDEDLYWAMSEWQRKQLVVHELTHALMNQHGYDKLRDPVTFETIADECGVRVANGELTPIYTYQGKTLSEIVPDTTCETANDYIAKGWL